MKDCYSAEVLSVVRLTPSMIRIELGRGDMHRFKTSGWPDEWVRLVFPAENGIVTMPRLIDGRWQMPQDRPRSCMRPYTVRRWNSSKATILIDFVLHEGGLASDWASTAKPGDKIGVTSPFGKYTPPNDARWVLLIADVTGLPAVARILEEMPDHLNVTVHMEVPEEKDIQTDIARGTDVIWHFGFGTKPGISRLLEITRMVELNKDPGYVWIAGEAKQVSDLRQHFAVTQGLDKDCLTAIGYWTKGKTRD